VRCGIRSLRRGDLPSSAVFLGIGASDQEVARKGAGSVPLFTHRDLQVTPQNVVLRAARWPGVAILLGTLAVAACGGNDVTTPATPTAVAVSATRTSLVPLDTTRLTALVTGAAGVAPSFSSSDPTIATVSSTGLVTAQRPGVAVMRATAGTVSDTISITVMAGRVIGSSGGIVTTPDAGVSLSVPSGALSTAVAISVKPASEAATPAPRAIAGTTYEFGPAGTTFAQPAALTLKYDASRIPADVNPRDLRIAVLTPSGWEILRDNTSVDSAAATVRANVRHFSTLTVVIDPCVASPANFPESGSAPLSGTISAATSCQSPTSRRYGAFFNFATIPPANSVVYLTASGTLNGIFGFTTQRNPGYLGSTIDASPIPGSLRLIANGDQTQFFVQGRDSTRFGTFTVQRAQDPGYKCPASGEVLTVFAPGASTTGQMSSANVCNATVAFPANNPYLGQPLRLHNYATFLTAGNRYLITASGVPANTPWSLSVFVVNLNGQYTLVRQSLYNGSSQTSRTVTIEPTGNTYFYIEVSSGGSRTGNVADWQTPLFGYALSVSRGTPLQP